VYLFGGAGLRTEQGIGNDHTCLEENLGNLNALRMLETRLFVCPILKDLVHEITCPFLLLQPDLWEGCFSSSVMVRKVFACRGSSQQS